jgi:PIN domain nuclease of toxin-antitoxin system
VSDLLLDTCALIWVLAGDPLDARARRAIADARLHVSAVSALEIAMLRRRGRMIIQAAPAAWFHASLAALDARLHMMTPDILFASQELAGDFNGDPFDRIVIATARHAALTVVTRDRPMLDYCAANGIARLRC